MRPRPLEVVRKSACMNVEFPDNVGDDVAVENAVLGDADTPAAEVLDLTVFEACEMYSDIWFIENSPQNNLRRPGCLNSTSMTRRSGLDLRAQPMQPVVDNEVGARRRFTLGDDLGVKDCQRRILRKGQPLIDDPEVMSRIACRSSEGSSPLTLIGRMN